MSEEENKKPKYVIAEGVSSTILAGAVNRLIEDGYLPHGNVVVHNNLLQPMMINKEENNIIF